MMICPTCSQPFTAKARQKYCDECRRYKNHPRDHIRRIDRDAHELVFIGVDGEGETHADGSHRYVLLTVGSASLYREDHAHLSWREIFLFLYTEFEKNPDAVYVGFYLGYDFAQWLRTIPESRGRSLFEKSEIAKRKRTRSKGNPTPYPVYIDEWECDILPGRRFKLRPKDSKKPWMYICDAGPFFQTSFVNAIDPSKWPEPIVSAEEYETIIEGKQHRSDARLNDKMITYNRAENTALSKLMTVMNKGLVQSGLRLDRKQWFGPGQAAQAWLNQINCPTGKEIRKITPQYALDAARSAYYGGWFEIFVHGHVPGVSYEYDEISSYPFTISTLPCLLHGTWTQGKGNPPTAANTYCIIHADVQGTNPVVGPLPHRTPKGTILRPMHTSGWYWFHELDAAGMAGLISTATVDEWVMYTPCDCPSPLADVTVLFEQRKQIGKNTAHGKALKLVYNSAYGKLAQSIGDPKFANAIWASLITAGTRTRIMKAIASHPRGVFDLLMVATDGVYFRSPHESLELSDGELGKWEKQEKHNLTLFMPGMYWDDVTRERLKHGEAPVLKSRGVSARALADRITEIDAAFHDMDDECTEWPTSDLNIKFQMITPSQAIQRRRWSLAGHVTQSTKTNPIIRTIDSNPYLKRIPVNRRVGDIRRSRAYPKSPFGPIESTPYESRFGEELHILMSEQQLDAIDPFDIWEMLS